MPFDDVKHLPDSVQRRLSPREQRMYLDVYNRAIQTFDDGAPRDRITREHEERAHQRAWAAVRGQPSRELESSPRR